MAEPVLSREDGWWALEVSARTNLNTSAEECLSPWDEDRIIDPESLRVQQVVAWVRFAR